MTDQMPAPTSVRLGISLVGVSLAVDAVLTLWPGQPDVPGRVGQAATTILIYGCLLYAIARRRNWARLVFAFLYVVAMPFAVMMMLRNDANLAGIAVTICLIALQGAGLVSLFLPTAAAWYHHGGAAA